MQANKHMRGEFFDLGNSEESFWGFVVAVDENCSGSYRYGDCSAYIFTVVRTYSMPTREPIRSTFSNQRCQHPSYSKKAIVAESASNKVTKCWVSSNPELMIFMLVSPARERARQEQLPYMMTAMLFESSSSILNLSFTAIVVS